MAKVVIIDDEASILELMTKVCRAMGHEVIGAQTGVGGMATIRQTHPDLLIVDLRIGDVDGLQIIQQCRADSPQTAIIMVTGHGSVETAVEAMRLGAYDYLTKPFELQDLKRTIEQALGKKSNIPLVPATPPDNAHEANVVGNSAPIRKILGIIKRVADNDSPVLLEGEFGVGKQLIARVLHESSLRNVAPYKAIQCSAFPPDLLEAELFGHGNPQSSIFARTRGGTIHLAEIHHLPMRIQAQLNAFLEQALSAPVNRFNGSGFNFRLITSTTHHLEDAIREGKFREDLYYKISVVPVHIPPLRERREDIPLLVEHILREQAHRSGGTMKKMEAYAEEFLEKYSWPGNISELRNTVERACALSEKESIQPTDLPPKVTQKVDAPMDPSNGEGTQKLPIGSSLDDFIRGQEKMFINETLKYNNGSREKTASMLGVSIATLYRKMELNVERRTTS
ncbi:MAG: sigma-54 dependent transcriptional regulator [Nitrospira sp.]